MAYPFKLRNVYVCWLVVKSKNSFCLPKNVCAIRGVLTSLLGTRTRWPTLYKWDKDKCTLMNLKIVWFFLRM